MTREEFEAIKGDRVRKVAGPWESDGGWGLHRLGADGKSVANLWGDREAHAPGVGSRWPKGMKRHAMAWADAWLIEYGYEVVEPVTFADAVSAQGEP